MKWILRAALEIGMANSFVSFERWHLLCRPGNFRCGLR